MDDTESELSSLRKKRGKEKLACPRPNRGHKPGKNEDRNMRLRGLEESRIKKKRKEKRDST